MIGGIAFRRSMFAVQAFALATACTAKQMTPPVAVTRTPIPVIPTVATSSPNSVQRWTLPDLRAWDVESRELAYVAESDPRMLRVRDLVTGNELSAAIPAGRQVTSTVILRGGIVYVAAVGADRYRPTAFEIRMYLREVQDDRLLQTLDPVFEAGQNAPLSPGLIASKDRTSLVWSGYEGSGGSVDTELRRSTAIDGSVTSVIRTRGVAFPVALSGPDVVIWKRAAGSHGSPTATDTYLISDGQERLLMRGDWTVDVATDGRALLQRGDTAQVREQLTGPVQLDLALDSQGAAAIAGQRIAWCSEQGFVTVFDLDQRSSQRFSAKGCAARIFLGEATVTWLESDPSRFALVRLQLP